MKCQCKHEVSCHLYNLEVDGYYGCELCDCEAFETPSHPEQNEPTELEF